LYYIIQRMEALEFRILFGLLIFEEKKNACPNFVSDYFNSADAAKLLKKDYFSGGLCLDI
jgi:hypothetical protein